MASFHCKYILNMGVWLKLEGGRGGDTFKTPTPQGALHN